ncbi:hypothetical protein E9993_16625 [Labilibacter sediminis]|nr:hypothetical protein E9993_16625 [Labilibacter sediminis]
MRTQYTISLWGKKEFVVLLFFASAIFSFSNYSFAQSLTLEASGKDCVNCFSSEIINSERVGNCLEIELQVIADNTCSSALSHLSVQIPCGIVSDISNSEGWKIANPSKDTTTGIYGFKIDDISGFGEDKVAGVFTVSFTICSDDEACLVDYENYLKLAYKAGECVFYEEITNEGEISASLVKSDVSCFGGNNGSLVVEVEGGVEPYSYVWSTGSLQSQISGLSAGEYSVVVTDSTGQQVQLDAQISQPLSAIEINAVVNQSSCGASDGSIQLDVTGGSGDYIYSWSNGASEATVIDLPAGNYSVQVTDSLDCSVSKSFNVTEDSDINITLTPNFLECHQEGQGEIISQVEGGVEPYSYLWSNQDTTKALSNVNSGGYALKVTDANGCSAKATTYIGLQRLSVITSVVNPTCYGESDGEISVIDVRYGTEPYKYLWNNGDTTQTITGIESGRYKVTVTDANGCQVIRTVNLAGRQALNFNYSISSRDCSSSDSAEINVEGSGGMPPYTYYINGEEVIFPLMTDRAGNYDITMKDALGCEMNKTITINELTSDIVVNTNVAQPACDGANTGAAEVLVSGGQEPYRFVWSDGIVQQNRNDLLSGEYIVEVVDINGCSESVSVLIDLVASVEASIVAPSAELTCESSGNILNANSSGANTFTWEILNNDTWIIENSVIDQLSYTVGSGDALIVYSVMNEEGCLASDTLLLTCINGDSSEGEDDEHENPTDPVFDNDCMEGCMYAEVVKVTPIENGCYQIQMQVNTSGDCKNELSHLNIGLDYGTVNWVKNSGNWPVEMNATDPKSDLYGFKIDEINNFGQSGSDQFTIDFEVCFNHPSQIDYFPIDIPMVFKAATDYCTQEVAMFTNSVSKGGIEASVFPNPFKDNLNITLVSQSNTEVEVAIYDIYGNKIERIYKGEVLADLKYTFAFEGPENIQRFFFYKILSKDNILQGKILRIK